MTIEVFIADDQEMVRAGFRMILDSTDDVVVVGEAANGRDAVEAVRDLRPDVCLFDVRMPGLDGVEATRAVVGLDVPEPPRVVIVTAFDLDEYVFGALEAGATGFLLKNSGPAMLVEAVRAAANGESLISPAITTRLLKRLSRPDPEALALLGDDRLTEREEEVLASVATGLTNAEIAEELHLSLSTVKAHLAALMAKLGVRNRVELVIWAFRTGRTDEQA